MATRPPLPHHGSHPGPARHHLSRLHVPQSISVTPNYFSEQALFTPGPTTGQAFMANNFPHGPQTAFLINTPGPGQSSFLAQQQQNRPPSMHRHHASLAIGMPPMTPGGGMFQQQQFAAMAGMQQPPGGLGLPPFVPRSKRTISIGGPPKAVLGGPNRKTSPMPPTPAGESAPGLPDVKKKKCTVKLPLEADQAPEDESDTRTKSLWSRTPVPASQLPPELVIDGELEATTAEPHPDHVPRRDLPNTIGVFLPTKLAWDIMRQEVIEEKLAKLGVERGSGANYLPSQSHSRAFSISTPADPSLLFSKLNKLQASQSPSSTSSPGPNSPFFHQPRLPHQHGYTQSLAVHQSGFGYSPQLGGGLDLTTQKSPGLSTSISIASDSESQGPVLHAPQGVVPVRATALSRPDFVRGFGLDVTEEEDEGQEEEPETQTPSDQNDVEAIEDGNGGFTQAFGQTFQVRPISHSQPEPEASEEDADDEGDDSMTAAAHSRHHSRHLSHASLRSLGRRTMSEEPPVNRISREDDLPEGESEYEQSQARSAVETWEGQDSSEVAQSESGVDEVEGEPEVADWTGSDTESTGEWSNPSDEERHRHERRVRKLARAQGNVNLPRRIPEFPHPPHVHSEPYLPQRVDRAQSEDIVSNPSEEGFVHVHSQVDSIHSHLVDQHQSGSLSPRPFRPLPPVPQSATHSRQTSANFVFNQTGSAEMRHVEPHSRGTSLVSVSQSGYGREALNPLAKPFVFGSIRGSSTSSIPFSQPVRGSIGSPSEFGPIAPPAGAHSRHASVSTVAPSATATKLNAGATEFKPSGGLFGNSSFTFKAPPGVPTLTFGSTDSTSSRALPDIPHQSPARAVQGREKRQRRVSDGVGLENTELDSPVEKIQKETPGRDNIATWRYPQSDTSPIVAPKPTVALNPAAKPFSFTGLVARVPVPVEAPHSTVSAPVGPVEKTPLTIFAPQTKRATLPEFALQASNNTVPASVFKSLSQSDGPTRPTVRSRLSSREAFEGHSNRPSLDDINVPSISLARKVSKPILVVQNENTPPRPSIDVFGPVQSSAQKPLAKSPIPGFLKLGAPPRRPSPSPNKSRLFSPDLVPSSPSEVGANTNDIRSVVQQVLEAKMDTLRKDLTSALSGKDFSLGHRTSDSTAAHSELDLELIRSTIESGQLSTRSMLQRELAAVMDRMDLISAAQVPRALEGARSAEESGAQLASVLHPISQLASQLTALEESIRHQRSVGQQDLLEQVVSSLRPQLEAVRAVPIDTDALTMQLSQAVKPHISQLIDLASDKRETAALIVQHLAPALNNIQPPRIDTASLAAQTASVLKSSIPAPTDPHVLKEHVADLVVERLDSRLAVRDSSYNAETISRKIMDALEPVLRPTELASAVSQVAEMSKNQQDVLSKTQDLVRAQEAQSTELARLPKALEEAVASLKSAQTDFMGKLNSLTPLEDVQKVAAENLNLQTQLGTARVAQEQATTEKDALAERLRAAEAELAALRVAAVEHEAVVAARDAEVAEAKSKEAAAQVALSEAQVKIEKSEALIRVKQERIASLEKVNDEKVQESHDLHMKVNTLELQVTYTSRDLESSKRVVSQLENQRNSLMAQQKHWDDLRRTADRVESLCQQMEQEDSEEIAELKRKVDESKILQGEHAYLKKRCEEQERRIADFNRGQQTAKQTVAQAQQQAAEWERRAKEAETELETYRTRAEELEDANTQLHENFTQLQLKVKDLTDEEEKRKQQTQSMQNQIVALEHQLDAVRGELAEATRPQTPVAPVPQRNGVVTGLPVGMHRSLSRLSQSTSVYTPTRQGTSNSLHAPNGMTNGKLDRSTGSASPPPESVWASMHAPTGDSLIPPQTPRPSHARQAQHHRPRVPSPAQSIASTAITRDDDGWYS